VKRVPSVLVLVVSLAPAAAFSQPSEQDSAAARVLFQQGRGLAAGEQWSEAADRFRRALALRPTAAIRYNLAAVLVQQGKLVEASELARVVLQEAPARDPARAASEALLREVEPAIALLTIRIGGDASDVEVLLDGSVLAPARVGAPTPVDPGEHTILVRRGSVADTRVIRLDRGGSAALEISLPPPAAPPRPALTVPPAPPPPARELVHPAPPPPEQRGTSSVKWPLVLGGVGLVGVGVVVDAVPSSGRNHEIDALDFVPVGLYVIGAAVAALGVL
jgi:hypothetical protein